MSEITKQGTPEAPARRSVGEAATDTGTLAFYFVLGLFLGVIFIKSEVASWFRIQEMFRFQAFHMYGVIGSAVAVGAIGVALLRRFGSRTANGEPIAFPSPQERRPSPAHVVGGTAFGVGWGLLGACPGPIYALIGTGWPVMLVGLGAALAGAWVYGLMRPSLPH